MKIASYKRPLASLFAFFCAATALAEVSLSKLISDNMVIQAGDRWQLTGNGSPGAKFKIRFNGDTDSIKIDSTGKWQYAPKLEAESLNKFKLEFDYTNKVSCGQSFTNLVVGRVWIISLPPNEGAATSAVNLRQIDKQDLERIRYCTITNFSDLPTKRPNSIEWKQCTLESLQQGDLALLAFEYALTATESSYVGIIQTYSEIPLHQSLRLSEIRTRSKFHAPLPNETEITWQTTNEQIAAAILAQNSRKVFFKRRGRVDYFPALSKYTKPYSYYPDNLFSTNYPPVNMIAFEWAFLHQGLAPSK